LVLSDILLLGRRQKMAIMNAVWPLTMLYWGPAGLLFYFWFCRQRSGADSGEKPMWQAAFSGATHCGAGCAVGDFLGDWLAFAIGFSLAGSELLGKFALAFAFAYLLGIAFSTSRLCRCAGLDCATGWLPR
jgi:hypothetical protein